MIKPGVFRSLLTRTTVFVVCWTVFATGTADGQRDEKRGPVGLRTGASRAEGNFAVRRIHEHAKPRPLPEGGPVASDVIMKAMKLRVSEDESQHDTFRALSAFHVTRLEWAYIWDKDAIAKCGTRGILFGGAVSSAMHWVPVPEGDSSHASLVCVNLHGTPVVPPWKRVQWERLGRPPGHWWLCVNNPALEQRHIEYLASCLDAGAQVMQRDEPAGNLRAVEWGGCFCDHCMSGFRQFLAGPTTAEERTAMGIDDIETFNYRELLTRQGAPVGDDFKQFDGGKLKRRFVDFQMQSTIAFHKRVRAALNEHAGRQVPVSCNNNCTRWTPIEMTFDWGFGELAIDRAQPASIHGIMRDAAACGRRQVITMPKKKDREDLGAWQRLTRQTVAMAYACGGHCMVPWDVYMPGDQPRYFGTPEQYADLFGFVRGCRDYLDGYEYAGAFGTKIACELYGDHAPLKLHGGSGLYAVIRALPGRADAPVAVHLVDWSERPEPFEVSLDSGAFFGNRGLKIKLLRPAAYDKFRHARAEESRSYGELVETIPLDGHDTASLALPPVNPWGVLVIAPDGV